MPLVNMAGPRRYTTITSGGGSGGTGNVGQVGSYAAMHLGTYPIYSIDMGLNDYAVHANSGGGAGTGTSTHVSAAWPLGGTGYCRITPPTTAGFERGIAVNNIWRNATLNIQEFNYRFEWRASSNFFSYAGDGSKFCLTHTRRTLAVGSAEDRPVIFLQKCNQHGGALDRANTCVFGPAGETVAGYCPDEYGDTWVDDPGGTVDFYLTCAWPFYLTNAGDSGTFQGAPKVEAGEVLTIEHRIVTKAVTGYPRGLMAYRLYRENGTLLAQKGIPWDWDTSVPMNAFFYELQQIGMGQWNTAHGGVGAYADVGGYITMARDLSVLQPGLGGWLGWRGA